MIFIIITAVIAAAGLELASNWKSKKPPEIIFWISGLAASYVVMILMAAEAAIPDYITIIAEKLGHFVNFAK